jgi:hypothetical protein
VKHEEKSSSPPRQSPSFSPGAAAATQHLAFLFTRVFTLRIKSMLCAEAGFSHFYMGMPARTMRSFLPWSISFFIEAFSLFSSAYPLEGLKRGTGVRRHWIFHPCVHVASIFCHAALLICESAPDSAEAYLQTVVQGRISRPRVRREVSIALRGGESSLASV